MMDTGHVIHTFTLSSQPRNFGRHAAESVFIIIITPFLSNAQRLKFHLDVSSSSSTLSAGPLL